VDCKEYARSGRRVQPGANPPIAKIAKIAKVAKIAKIREEIRLLAAPAFEPATYF